MDAQTTKVLGMLCEIVRACEPTPSETACPAAMFNVGDKLFLRTVTYHLVGEVARIEGEWIELEGASWVANSGRFMQAIKDGLLSEVEPVGTAFVNLATVTDAFPWLHDLPMVQK